MNARELAERLDGMEYRSKIPEELITEATACGLVIVMGQSDDNMELLGFFQDEYSCYGGGTFKVDKEGIIINECDCDGCPYHQAMLRDAKNEITAVWDDGPYAWTYDTEIPHETFEVLEEGEKYCRGIVFSVDDLK